MKLRFMTYNIQHGLDYGRRLNPGAAQRGHDIDLAQIASVIRLQSPDILGLNEVRGLGTAEDYTAQAETLAAMLGWHCYFARALMVGGTQPFGNAILSRFPIQSAETIPIPDPLVRDEDAYYETRCVLRARFQEAGGFTVLISHFGLAKAEQRNAVATVRRLLEEEQGPVVVMGDFNMSPGDPILEPLLRELDDAASLIPQPCLSFPSHQPEVKIDYLLSRGARQLEAAVPAIVASDHRPHTAVLEIEGRAAE